MITTTIAMPQVHPDPKKPPPAPNANLMTSFLFVSNGLKFFDWDSLLNNRLCTSEAIWYNLEKLFKNFYEKHYLYIKKHDSNKKKTLKASKKD